MEANGKRRLSDESADQGTPTNFKIPKRTTRCGTCRSCLTPDCGDCMICHRNAALRPTVPPPCKKRGPCEQPNHATPEKPPPVMVPMGGGLLARDFTSSTLAASPPPMLARCGECMGCQRQQPCLACYQCTRGRPGACVSRTCSVQQREGLQRILQAKMQTAPKENGTNLNSVLNHLTPSPDKSKRGRQPITERCRACEGCLRTERCGECSSCLKQAACSKLKCREQIRANNERQRLKKMEAANGGVTPDSPQTILAKRPMESWSTSPSSPAPPALPRAQAPPRCQVCPGCVLTQPCKECSQCQKGSNDCLKRRCKEKTRFYNEQQTLKRKLALKQLAELEAGELAPAGGAPASPLAMVANPMLFSPSTPKAKAPKTKRCGACEGCLATTGCGTCGFCKGDPKMALRCVARHCKNKIVVEGRTPKQTSPSKETKRKGRCGECELCKEDDCGECENCEKRKAGEFMRSNQYCYNKKCVVLEEEKKKPKIKKSRCGVCEGCKMSDGCGQCPTCLKGFMHLCRARHCRDPIETEVVPRGERQEFKPSEARGRRCQECDGCKTDPCGSCNACEKTPDLCKERECTNRVVRGKNKYGSAPIVQNKDAGSIKKGSNPRRYKRCGECDGCKMEACGNCQSCRHNKEYADQMLAPATCENIICEDPIDLFGTNHKVLSEDGTCPTKVIMGKLYDFRCYFCKTLPRVGMANRSELYRHYSVMHYVAELKSEFGAYSKKCKLCSKDVKNASFISHMGQVHDEVHKYLPERAKIPRKVQKSGTRTNRRGAVFATKRFTAWDFPDIPVGYDIKGEFNRSIQLPQKEPEVLEVDGFEIELDVDFDEPLMVSRDEPYKAPEYSGGAKCIICASVFAETVEAVLHIHKIHNIKGGSPHIMVDAERLLKAGYLAQVMGSGATVTNITEKGKTARKSRVHRALRAVPAKGMVKLVGSGLPNDTKPPSRRPSIDEGSQDPLEEQPKESVDNEEKNTVEAEVSHIVQETSQ